MDPATPEGRQSAGKPKGTTKEKRPGGNGDGVAVEGVTFSKSKERMPDLLVTAAYAVQCRGAGTVAEVYDDFTSVHGLNSKVRSNTISDALESLRKMEILAEGQNADGERVFSMKRVKFNCNPEIAQVKHLIEELKADAAGMLIVEKFTKPGGSAQKQARPEEPADFELDVVALSPIIAGQVWDGNLLLQHFYFAAGKWFSLHQIDKNGELKTDKNDNYIYKPEYADHSERPLVFERTEDKKIMVTHSHALQNYFAKNVRAFVPPGTEGFKWQSNVEDYFGFEDVVCDVPDHMLTIMKLPVMRANTQHGESKGAGLNNHEALKPGLKFTICFTCPTKNFIKPGPFKFWLSRILRKPIRGMSPARGGRTRGLVLKELRCRPWSSWDDGWQTVE